MPSKRILNNPTGGLFVTGTGTEVGKTVVTAALARRARRLELDCIALKPVQTGARRMGDGWILPDCDVYRAAGQAMTGPVHEEFAYVFEPACSPHLAAEMAGRTIDLDPIVRFVETFRDRHDCVLVEGVGGIAVPLNEKQTVLDLMKALALPVLLVADNRLGGLNHALLSIEAIRAAGLDVSGVILTNTTPVTDENRFIREDNRRTIERFGGVAVLTEIDHIAGFDPNNEDHWRRIDACLGNIY